ncbi:unnamed protein product [Protopolystoma xenopodis]|uniref:Uncharacterized protein n=1 Tax=Protopolystoma xenopodis TaxID=117903 RepID=A0A3S5AD09_9PLAT|nr:unnamed protein product [Protopolystoma xenopodis]
MQLLRRRDYALDYHKSGSISVGGADEISSDEIEDKIHYIQVRMIIPFGK